MSTEESKKIVLGFFENLNAGNAAAALDALSDSATWWIQGNFPLSGTRTKAQFIELLSQLRAIAWRSRPSRLPR
jgi:ketosteroid isomerase-like protein